MGDRLVVVTNPENAAAGWRVENMGADFYDNSDVGWLGSITPLPFQVARD